jgi:hypothetical protein
MQLNLTADTSIESSSKSMLGFEATSHKGPNFRRIGIVPFTSSRMKLSTSTIKKTTFRIWKRLWSDFPTPLSLHNPVIVEATKLVYELGKSQEDENREGSVLAMLIDSPTTTLFIR